MWAHSTSVFEPSDTFAREGPCPTHSETAAHGCWPWAPCCQRYAGAYAEASSADNFLALSRNMIVSSETLSSFIKKVD